jgi:hypothetical protein
VLIDEFLAEVVHCLLQQRVVSWRGGGVTVSRLQDKKTWVQILPLKLSGFVTLGKLLNLAETQFHILGNRVAGRMWQGSAVSLVPVAPPWSRARLRGRRHAEGVLS